jgi:Glycosyltransferase family 87
MDASGFPCAVRRQLAERKARLSAAAFWPKPILIWMTATLAPTLPKPPLLSPRPTLLAWAALLVFLLFELTWIYWVHSNGKLIDYYAYDVASAAVAQGISPYYMDRATIDALALQRGLSADVRVPSYLYSPFLAALLRPLQWLTAPKAAVLWSLGSLIALTLSGCVLSQLSSRRWIDPAVFFMLTLLAPAMTTFYAGQVNHYLLLLMSAAAWALERGRARVVGAALATGILLKTIPLSWVGVLLLRKQWRSLQWLVICALGLAALTVLWVGVDPYLEYFGKAWGLAGGGQPPMVPVNQSLRATAHRLFGAQTGAVVALWVSVLIALSTFVVLVCTARKSSTVLLDIALLMPAVALVAPISWSHHQVLLSLPLVILMRSCRGSVWQGASRGVVIVAIVLLDLVSLAWRQLAPWPALQSSGTAAMLAVWLALLAVTAATLWRSTSTWRPKAG